jgi:hypothetical protein
VAQTVPLNRRIIVNSEVERVRKTSSWPSVRCCPCVGRDCSQQNAQWDNAAVITEFKLECVTLRPGAQLQPQPRYLPYFSTRNQRPGLKTRPILFRNLAGGTEHYNPQEPALRPVFEPGCSWIRSRSVNVCN